MLKNCLGPTGEQAKLTISTAVVMQKEHTKDDPQLTAKLKLGDR
jgi:hypothetical protein